MQCYPYLPHFIDISIDIMSGLLSQSGALRHYGGSNRTIIKQAYELLVNERTALASKSIGTLVTLDRIFDLGEGNLSSEKSKDINNIIIRFKDGWPARVVKVVCLLEFLKELPRTDVNIAACLVDEVGRPSPLPEVREAIMLLEKENALHVTQAGWSLPTRDFINWKRKKDGIKAPVTEKKKIVRDAISKIFADQGISKYRYRNIKSFDLSVSLDEMERGPAPSGGFRLRLFSEDEISDRDEMKRRLQEASWAGKDDFHFLIYLDSMIDDLAAGIYRSERMVSEYNQLKAQSKINSEEIALLEEEKKEKARLEGLLGQKITQAIGEGTSIFRGVVRDASDLGEGPDAIFRALFEEGVPVLYPMLTHFNIPLKGGEAEMLLKAANLNGLTSAFCREDPEEDLLVKEGSSYKPNDRAVLLRSLMDYLKERKSYSDNEALQGRALEEHFKGIGFGADPEVVRLGLALLFRAGRIEVSSAGQRFDSYQEPKSREPFTNVKTFRAAHFHPLEIPATPTLVRALKACENLTGERIEAVEMVAISSAARSFADKTIARLLPVEAIVVANGLLGKEQLAELKGLLEKMKKSSSTDSVHLLANEGERIRGLVDLLNRIRQHSDRHSVDLVRRARVAAGEMAAVLEARGQKDIAEARSALQELLASEDIYSSQEALRACSEEIERSYHALYSDLHLRRGEAFSAALRELEGSESWAKAGEPGRTQAIRELSMRACQQTPAAKALACSKCGAAVGQMDSDLAALGSFTEAAKSELARLAKPIAGPTITTTATTAVDAVERKTQKVALKSFFAEPMDSEEAVNQAVAKLREHLLELALEGRRRVKEQLKKMGSFEYHQTSFSYIDNVTREERFVGVPEEGGRDLISQDPLAPGSIYGASVDDQGKAGLFRLEVGLAPGTGKLRMAGGINSTTKESIQRAFAYINSHKVKMGIAQAFETADFHVEAIDLLVNHISCDAGIGLVVAIYSALLKQPVLQGLLVLGDLSIQGNIKAVRSLVEPLQIGMDNGARCALIPIENKRHFLEVSGDIVERVDPIFYSDPLTAARKALGLK